jgi:hypothetical protein
MRQDSSTALGSSKIRSPSPFLSLPPSLPPSLPSLSPPHPFSFPYSETTSPKSRSFSLIHPQQPRKIGGRCRCILLQVTPVMYPAARVRGPLLPACQAGLPSWAYRAMPAGLALPDRTCRYWPGVPAEEPPTEGMALPSWERHLFSPPHRRGKLPFPAPAPPLLRWLLSTRGIEPPPA